MTITNAEKETLFRSISSQEIDLLNVRRFLKDVISDIRQKLDDVESLYAFVTETKSVSVETVQSIDKVAQELHVVANKVTTGISSIDYLMRKEK
jgi:hypothetical protein